MPRFFIDPDISKAKTISTDFYTSPEYFEESKEKIFAKSWQFATDIQNVKETGSVYPFLLLENYLNEPLILTRDKYGQIRCMSNVCTHRGNLIAYGPCKVNQLRCKYHGRQFGCARRSGSQTNPSSS